MTEVRRFGLVDVLLLLLVLASAAGTRASYLVVCAENGTNAGPWRVQDDPPQELLSLALNLKERNWFGSEAPLAAAHQQELTAHTAPAYPWLLSLVARLPVVFDPAVRWLQVGLGTLTAGLYFLFARRAFRSRFVALLAGLLCACHPFWVVNAAEMNDGVLTSFLLALVLVLGARSSEVEDAFCCLVFGLALAALALVRAALLPLSFVALLWFLLRCRSLPRGWLFALLATLGFANGLAPWILRNYQATGELIPVVDSLYLHLWIGNNPQAGGGPQSEEVLLRTLAEARKESSGNLADMPQSRRYEELAGEVWQEIRAHPVGFFQHRLWAGLCFVFGEKWFRDRVPWQEDPAHLRSMPSWLVAAFPSFLLGSLLGMLLLSFLGWRWTYAWRGAALPALAVVWIALPYLLSHAEQLHGPRLPLDGVLLCYTSFALATLFRLGKLPGPAELRNETETCWEAKTEKRPREGIQG